MTTVLCTSQAGRMIAVKTAAATSAVIRISGFPVFLGIVTKVEMGVNVAAQFQNTFDNGLYVVPFGDAVGELRLTLLVKNVCGENTQNNGVGALLDAYKSGRLLPGSRRRVGIALGGSSFTGFLTGVLYGNSAESSGSVSSVVFVFKEWVP
jgi:hypothetical protein